MIKLDDLRDYFELIDEYFVVVTADNVYVRNWQNFPGLMKWLWRPRRRTEPEDEIIMILYGTEEEAYDTKDMVQRHRGIEWTYRDRVNYFKNMNES